MSYEQVKDLPPAEFKRLCGVQPETFRRMVEAVSTLLNKRRRVSGRPTKLSVEDQVLMTLEYWREYRTFFHIAQSCGLHESSVWRTTPAGGRYFDKEPRLQAAGQSSILLP